MKLNKIIFGALALLFSFTLFSCQDTTDKPDNGNQEEEKTELKFKSAVLVSVDGTSDLSIKAAVNGDKGTIYAVLTDTDTTPTAEQIVTPTGVVWSGNSGSSQSLEETITGLTGGKTYYGFFVIKEGNDFSSIVKKSAEAMEVNVDKGEGTMENPFKVSTIEDLEHVGAGPYDKYGLEWNATETHYVLVNDIDLSEKYGEGKENWSPLTIAEGASFDGKGYTISGVYFKGESTSDLGLFSMINTGATVKNLSLTNVRITSNGYNDTPRKFDETKEGEAQYTNSNISGFTASGIYVGSLAGSCKGILENIHVTDSVLKISGSRVGGLVGRLYGDTGTMIKVNNVSVEAAIEGVSRIGGIVGLIDAKKATVFETTSITNATFKGSIKSITTVAEDKKSFTAGEYIGGFAGYARAFEASNIVVDAKVEGLRHVGGLVGFLQKNPDLPNPSILKASIFKGTAVVEIGTNAGPLVGNRSNGKTTDAYPTTEENCIAQGFYLSTSKFMKNDQELEFDKLAGTAKFGTSVETLTEAWFTENLPTFDFEKVFKLVDGFPTLK